MTSALAHAAPSLPETVLEQLDPEARLSTWVRRYWEKEVPALGSF